MEIDYLIIGQGIGGSLIAEALLRKGKTIQVIDHSHLESSSMVAAGLFNPVVFKRFVESWKAKELILSANSIYKSLEKILGDTFFHEKNIYKIFANTEEKSLWNKKSIESLYMSDLTLPGINPQQIENNYGGGVVTNSGYLDITKFLNIYRKRLIRDNLLINSNFDYKDLILEKSGVTWNEIHATTIIFCEGARCTNNPFFSWLPFKPTKGEVLTVKIPNLNPEYVINKGVFILPLGEQLFKVGSTYEWQNINTTPSDNGREEISNKLKKILKIPFEIIDHQAGIRPTVSDRRPLIGIHPINKSLAIFNGLGTKGVMIAPYFSEQFANHLVNKESLNSEVDIFRYYNHL